MVNVNDRDTECNGKTTGSRNHGTTCTHHNIERKLLDDVPRKRSQEHRIVPQEHGIVRFEYVLMGISLIISGVLIRKNYERVLFFAVAQSQYHNKE